MSAWHAIDRKIDVALEKIGNGLWWMFTKIFTSINITLFVMACITFNCINGYDSSSHFLMPFTIGFATFGVAYPFMFAMYEDLWGGKNKWKVRFFVCSMFYNVIMMIVFFR